MKKLIQAVCMSLCMAGGALAYSFGDLYRDVADQSKLTILDGDYTPVYLYEFRADEKNRGGFFKPVYSIAFIEAGFGFRTPYRASEIGAVVGGGGVRFDKIFNIIVEGIGGDPEAWTQAIIPVKARKFWNATRFGYLMGHDFDTHSFTDMVYAGLAFKLF